MFFWPPQGGLCNYRKKFLTRPNNIRTLAELWHKPVCKLIFAPVKNAECVFFFFFFFLSTATPVAYGSSGLGVKLSCSCWLMLQPQQHWIRTTPLDYITVCGNAESLTWARPAFSQTLCRVLNPLSHKGNSKMPIPLAGKRFKEHILSPSRICPSSFFPHSLNFCIPLCSSDSWLSLEAPVKSCWVRTSVQVLSMLLEREVLINHMRELEPVGWL